MFSSFNFSGNQRLNSELRGGPALIVPGHRSFYLGAFSNQQKKFSLELNTGLNYSLEKDFKNSYNLNVGVGYRPMNSLSINLTPGFSKSKYELQYVTTQDYLNNKRYVMAYINRNTVNMSLRINYNITPDLSIQYWGQPFIATGEYSKFKYITDSKAETLHDRYQLYTSDQIQYDINAEIYAVDENHDGNTDYSFDKPDFNVKEFLSNLVLRWEYRPGSTVYLVWSQNRSLYVNDGTFDFSNNIKDLFDKGANDIFLVKFSYRFGT